MIHVISIAERQTEVGTERDLVVVAAEFRACFPIPRSTSKETSERLVSHPPLLIVLDLWGRTRREAVLSLYSTAALVASMALELGGQRAAGDEQVLRMLEDGSLKRASVHLCSVDRAANEPTGHTDL